MTISHWWGETFTYTRKIDWTPLKDIEDIRAFETPQTYKLTPVKEDWSRTPEQVKEEQRARKARRQQAKKSKKRNR